MPDQPWQCPLLALLRQPGTGWLLLAMTYLTAAVVSVYLAVSMSVWWPLVLVVAMLLAASACAVAAVRAGHKLGVHSRRGTGHAGTCPNEWYLREWRHGAESGDPACEAVK